ncbi:MAG: hypothetical protein NBV66_11100 [Burkholderiaceae bacterium]|nr:hypothetical protein [Burkholderiaceae bacterium]
MIAHISGSACPRLNLIASQGEGTLSRAGLASASAKLSSTPSLLPLLLAIGCRT